MSADSRYIVSLLSSCVQVDKINENITDRNKQFTLRNLGYSHKLLTTSGDVTTYQFFSWIFSITLTVTAGSLIISSVSWLGEPSSEPAGGGAGREGGELRHSVGFLDNQFSSSYYIFKEELVSVLTLTGTGGAGPDIPLLRRPLLGRGPRLGLGLTDRKLFVWNIQAEISVRLAPSHFTPFHWDRIPSMYWETFFSKNFNMELEVVEGVKL